VPKKNPPPSSKRLSSDNRKKVKISRNKAFGFNFEKDLKIEKYSEPGDMTPPIDPHYVFPEKETRILLWGLANGDRILLTGPTGSGKSSLVEQIAARLNYNVFKLNLDGHISRADLIGEYVVKNQNMVFMYGILPKAMSTPGSIILLDEWDTINEDTSFVIQRLLQRDDGKVIIYENGGEIRPLHTSNCVVATANTVGQGDYTGLYTHGTRAQNYAQINRFSMCLRIDYLPPRIEEEILMGVFSKHDISLEEVTVFVQAINKVRDGFANGQLSVPLSTRDLINWVEKYLFTGDPMLAADICFLGRMTLEDSEVCKGIVQRAIGC
jgi:cobaltochelatase CobS